LPEIAFVHLLTMIVQAVGDAFNNGFYEEQVKLRSLPLLESRPQRFMRNLAAKDAISRRKVQPPFFFMTSSLCT
jgi:chloride channel 7